MRQIDDSGARLRARRSKIEEALAQALNDRTPELRNPLDVSREKLLEVWRRLSVLAKREGVWQSVLYECDSSPAFYECEWRGTPLNLDSAREVGRAYKRVGDQCFESVKRILGHPGEGEGSRNQLAVGLTHEQRGNPRGASSLLRRGAETVAEAPAAASRPTRRSHSPPDWASRNRRP